MTQGAFLGRAGEPWKRALWVFLFGYTLISLLQYVNTTLYIFLAGNFLMPMIIGFTGIVLVLGRPFRRIEGLLLGVLAGWHLLTQIANGGMGYLDYNLQNYGVIAYSFLFFPLASLLPKPSRKGLLHGILHGVIALFAVGCILAVIAALTGRPFQLANSGLVGMMDKLENRLYVFCHPNISGTFCTLTILLSVYLALSTKRTAVRVYLIILTLLFSLTLALTDSRTNMIATAVGMGCLGFVFARTKLPLKGKWVSIGVSVLCAALVVVLCYFSFNLYTMAFNQASRLTLVSHAYAEDAASTITNTRVIRARGLGEDSGSMNGRSIVWGAVFRAIAADPIILLTGVGHQNAMAVLSPYTEGIAYLHTHNAFLQTLISSGLPALLLLVAFLMQLLHSCLRLLMDTSEKTSLATRFLPAVLLAAVVVSMAESQFFISDYMIYDPLFFLVAGYVTVIAPKARRKKVVAKAAVEEAA